MLISKLKETTNICRFIKNILTFEFHKASKIEHLKCTNFSTLSLWRSHFKCLDTKTHSTLDGSEKVLKANDMSILKYSLLMKNVIKIHR